MKNPTKSRLDFFIGGKMGNSFRFYYHRMDFIHPIIIEYRTVFSDINVTPWRHWKNSISFLADCFESVEDAKLQSQRLYGPITHYGYSNNLYMFESDNNFQIRFIDIDHQFEDDYPDIEPIQKPESPWKIDFAKELK